MNQRPHGRRKRLNRVVSGFSLTIIYCERKGKRITQKKPEDHTEIIMRLDYALDGYWLARKRDFSPHTVDDYQRTFQRLCDYLGPNMPIEKISARHLHDFLNHVQSKYRLNKKTLSNVWIALSSLWTWADRELRIEHVIRNQVPQPRYRSTPVEAFTEDEVHRLLHACETNGEYTTSLGRRTANLRSTALRDTAIMLTLLDSGMRASELAQLMLADYDQSRGQLIIRHGKGGKRRIVYLGERARKSLWK
jgi:site-specific recombinase XerD